MQANEDGAGRIAAEATASFAANLPEFLRQVQERARAEGLEPRSAMATLCAVCCNMLRLLAAQAGSFAEGYGDPKLNGTEGILARFIEAVQEGMEEGREYARRQQHECPCQSCSEKRAAESGESGTWSPEGWCQDCGTEGC